jgi:hypothetical protein
MTTVLHPHPILPGFTSWPAATAAVATLGLLLAFLLVVQQAVRQGETRRRAAAFLVEASWRCNALREPAQAVRCLAAFRGMTQDSVELQTVALITAASATWSDR